MLAWITALAFIGGLLWKALGATRDQILVGLVVAVDAALVLALFYLLESRTHP